MDFDEKSCPVVCKTSFGRWWQTVDEVQIEIDLQKPTSSKDISCTITNLFIKCTVAGNSLIEGTFEKPIKSEDSTWTLEDKTLIRILLSKSCPDAGNLWSALFKDGERYSVDPYTLDQMQQKLTLQRFQIENPGMDFSGAEISGNYHGGGPKLPEYQSK